MPTRLRTQNELLAELAIASPEQRAAARVITTRYLTTLFRPDALLAERDVLEMIEALLIQAVELGSLDQL